MHKTYKKSLVLNKRIIQLTVLITLAITGCAKINHVSTNLDRDNFKHYFSPTKVKMVEKEQDLAGKYKFLGLVEGESCQEKAYHAAPNEIDARTEARRKAYQLGANAIIFSQCVMITDDKAAKYCLASTVCYGRAFKVEQENK
ncbi:rcsF protein [Colwellia sp. M166]|jgi:RcsF protein|uniref:Rcs stress response system protein RcsF n=1 Tax=Colwellia sp. M166 TaxID=2583805 RepID=UPI00211F0B5E|nr:Rcs stress response system protein RcsF [Colwellia sp. M166]UUO25020.1 rcsF protein [Colwellia sp. M166]|tara:strand:+ start:3672 stop:4100 length:429 start_codon:yes stop_codon:yes gene_type:complete